MAKASPKLPFFLLSLMLAACGESEQLPASAIDPIDDDNKIPVTTESADALAAFVEGRALYESLHYPQARELFERAIELDPDFALAQIMLATIAESREDFFHSVEKAKAGLPGKSIGEQLIVNAFVAAMQGQRDEQLAMLRKLVALYPGDERSHSRLASLHVARQEYAQAVEHFNHSISINPEFAPAWNMLGYAYRGKEDFDAAKRAFQRYIELVPDEPNPYDSFAELLMESGDYAASIEMYGKALEIEPNFYPSRAGISIGESLRGNHETAIATAREMVERAHEAGEQRYALMRLAGAYLYAGDTESALATIDRMAGFAADAGNLSAVAEAREYAADVLVVNGDAGEAMSLYQQALELRREASLPPPLMQKAQRQFLFKATFAELHRGWTRAAQDYLAQYKSAVATTGDDADRQRLTDLKGLAALMREDYREAADLLSGANRQSPVANYLTAMAYEGAGDTDAALRYARRAANRNTLSPSHPLYRRQALAMIERVGGSLALLQ